MLDVYPYFKGRINRPILMGVLTKMVTASKGEKWQVGKKTAFWLTRSMSTPPGCKEGIKSNRNPQAGEEPPRVRMIIRSKLRSPDGRNSVSKGVLINIAIPAHVCIAILNSCYFMVLQYRIIK